MAKRSVQKIGNSLLISIPADIVKEFDIKKGDTLKIENTSRQIIINKE